MKYMCIGLIERRIIAWSDAFTLYETYEGQPHDLAGLLELRSDTGDVFVVDADQFGLIEP